jgi:hypothetical protein
MPGLKPTLLNYDLDFLLRIARYWGVTLNQRDVDSARADLYTKMLEPELLRTALERLPTDARQALEGLSKKEGRQTWAEFSRAYGDIRVFGPARRTREEPDLNPVSISEVLWYAGLVGRAFLKSGSGPVEFVYIPDELLQLIAPTRSDAAFTALRPAVNQEPRYFVAGDTVILDLLTDLLAALRMGHSLPDSVLSSRGIPLEFLIQLLLSVELIDETRQPDPEKLKAFFGIDRDQALSLLFMGWLSSTRINDLRMLPGVIFEGSWRNDPLIPRRLVTGLLADLQTGTWWSLSSLVTMVKTNTPDFQRPAGDYDSWFIRDAVSNEYLRGFEHWDRLEGSLIHSLVTGPLHWFGIVDLARGSADGKFTAFRLVEKTAAMLTGEVPVTGLLENHTLRFKDVIHVFIPPQTPRALRYQVARCGELMAVQRGESHYRLTPRSLQAAAGQGLKIGNLIQLIQKEYNTAIPPETQRMVERWNLSGVEAELRTEHLLRFKDARACSEFLSSKAAAALTIEVLNPTTLLVQSRQQDVIIKVLNEMGILVEQAEDV